MKTRLALYMLVIVSVALVACGTVKISEINADPSRFANKEVSIAGEVVNSIGALGQGAYEMDDGTGRLWVLSEGFGVPGKGARVRVTGRVQTGVTFDERSFGTVLRQTKARRSR